MGLFDKLFGKDEAAVELAVIEVDDNAIVAMADGELIDVSAVKDDMFAQQMMGQTIAFKYETDKVIVCSPANGTLGVLFPTGHAFGIVMNNGVELLVHIGVDTVNANGEGFKKLNKNQGDVVKAGEPIVEVNIKKLSQKYEMSTMLIVTRNEGDKIDFIDPQVVARGQNLLK